MTSSSTTLNHGKVLQSPLTHLTLITMELEVAFKTIRSTIHTDTTNVGETWTVEIVCHVSHNHFNRRPGRLDKLFWCALTCFMICCKDWPQKWWHDQFQANSWTYWTQYLTFMNSPVLQSARPRAVDSGEAKMRTASWENVDKQMPRKIRNNTWACFK